MLLPYGCVRPIEGELASGTEEEEEGEEGAEEMVVVVESSSRIKMLGGVRELLSRR